jgi:LacI family transcriptional regulator, galactose operon repressor
MVRAVETLSDAPAGRRPTMKDVAALAGVSLATVSRVVNDSGDVRDDLAARVRDAVSVLGYRRDLTASTLRRADRLSASIGLVLEDVGNPFFSAVQRGVEDIARRRGVLTFAGSSDEEPARERELAESLSARGIDGLVMAPCGADQAYLARERDAGVALVFVDRLPRLLDADSVVTDNRGGARAAVEHLLAAGHRRIGFLGDRQSIYTAAERRRGYREALAGAGISADPALERYELIATPAAAAAAHDMLTAPDGPTALFASQNLITVGCAQTLRALGRHHEVALVGFDDVPLADLVEPGLTVVAQHPVSMGRRAAELLFERLDGFDGPARNEVISSQLIVRGSGEIAAP